MTYCSFASFILAMMRIAVARTTATLSAGDSQFNQLKQRTVSLFFSPLSLTISFAPCIEVHPSTDFPSHQKLLSDFGSLSKLKRVEQVLSPMQLGRTYFPLFGGSSPIFIENGFLRFDFFITSKEF